jgi:hypothetical protein
MCLTRSECLMLIRVRYDINLEKSHTSVGVLFYTLFPHSLVIAVISLIIPHTHDTMIGWWWCWRRWLEENKMSNIIHGKCRCMPFKMMFCVAIKRDDDENVSQWVAVPLTVGANVGFLKCLFVLKCMLQHIIYVKNFPSHSFARSLTELYSNLFFKLKFCLLYALMTFRTQIQNNFQLASYVFVPKKVVYACFPLYA